MPKILVHEKALAHLSRGLYRSPASALRELVSNAWDANATEIRINTNYPFFYQLSIEDNGDGFTKTDFDQIMGGGIGNSNKRKTPSKLINNRPIIGRLGIGMLGIAQICGSFTIVSKPKTGDGFRARVRLYDLLKEKLDQDDTEIVTENEINVGEYDFEQYEPEKYLAGTFIFTDDIHPTFVRSFQQSLQFEKFREPSLDWGKALEVVSDVRSLQELGDYWRFLWELSVSCPVPYFSDQSLPFKLIAKEQDRIMSYDFKVIVDGIQLRKPIQLSNNPGGYTYHKIDSQSQKVYGREVRFHGYIIVQEGSQLHPDELRGILIRIKNLSIGYYDPSMLDYRYNEGPRSRWLTGEIYIDEGLEDALNIDRDSFNRFHPEFRAIQEYIHKILHTKIFPVSYKKIEERSVERANTRVKERKGYLEQVISTAINIPVDITSGTLGKTKVSDFDQEQLKVEENGIITNDVKSKISVMPKVEVSKKRGRIEINLPNPVALKTKKSNQQLASAILVIFELAVTQEETHEKQRQTFTNLLLKLLERW